MRTSSIAIALLIVGIIVIGGISGPAHAAALNGMCGDAQMGVFPSNRTLPAKLLCRTGAAEGLNNNGGKKPWTWTCKGQNSGMDAACIATSIKPTNLSKSGIPEPLKMGLTKAINLESSVPVTAARSSNVTGPIVAKDGQVIENLSISSSTGPCIVIGYNVRNVVIRNNVIGPCANGAIPDIGVLGQDGSTKVQITRNVIHDVARGAYFHRALHPIYFDHNYVYNVQGPFPGGQMIQFDKVVDGSSESKIMCNVSDGLGNANQKFEDHINMWMSKGLQSRHTLIAYNRIRGGTSKSGSGINVGDGGGSNVDVINNTVVHQGNVGVSIASGENIIAKGNLVFADGSAGLPGAGLVVNNYYPGTTCRNISVSDNRVYSFDIAWWVPPRINSFWPSGNCEATIGSNIFDDTTLNEKIFDVEYKECEAPILAP